MRSGNCTVLSALTLLLLVATLHGAALAQTTVTYQDGDFPNASWTTTVEALNGGGSVNAFQVATGGAPLAFRRVENTLNSAVGTGVSNSVFAFHRFAGGIFDPATSGAILSIVYSEDSQRIANGQQACGLALRQGGIIYYGPSFLNPLTLGVWATTTQTRLVASQFDALAPGLQTPDFSASGGQMEFGFYRANSTSVGGGGGTTYGGIDNWRVTLTVDSAVPTTISTWGHVQTLFGAGGATR